MMITSLLPPLFHWAAHGLMMKNPLRVTGGVWQGWRQSTYKPLATPWPPQAKSTTQCAY